MNDTLMPFSVSSSQAAHAEPGMMAYDDYQATEEEIPAIHPPIGDRDPVVFVVDVTAALSPADAFRILEGVLHGMVQQMEAQDASPPKNCPVGVDCGTLVLTPKLLQKMVVILRKYQCTMAMVYARLPQTQQAALGMGLLVREVPERAMAFNIHEWMEQEHARRSASSSRPSLSERMPESPIDPNPPLAPMGIHAFTETVVPVQAPEWQELAPAPVSESYQVLPTEVVATEMMDSVRPPESSTKVASPVVHTQRVVDEIRETSRFDPVQKKTQPESVAPVSASVAAQPTLQTPVPEKISDHSRPMEMTMLPSGVSPELVAAHTLPTRLVQGSLRSGQTVASDGHLVVLGDVHGGSEIVAAGHIVVWGELRGVAHAGALVTPSGDVVSSANSSQVLKTLGEDASIRSLSIRAVQLRIGRYIARRPDRVDNHKPERPLEADTPVRPEMAKVVDREIRIYESLA